MKGGLLILITVTIVTFIIDSLTNKCLQKNLEVGVLTFTHHLVYNFALLGWLLDDFAALLVYLALPFISILHWNTSNCVINDVIADTCDEDKDFNHLGRQIGISHHVTMVLVSIGWIIAAYKMYRLLKERRCGPKAAIPPIWCMSKKCMGNVCKI